MTRVTHDHFLPLPEGPLPREVELDDDFPPGQAVDPTDPALAAPRNRWIKPALLALTALLLAAALNQVVGLVHSLARLHPALGALGLALVGVALGVAALALWRGRNTLKDQRTLTRLRARAGALRNARSYGGFAELEPALRDYYRGKPQLDALEEVLAELSPDWEDGEQLAHVEERFLAPLRSQAAARVQDAALQAGVMVAFSPWIILDMVLVLWRTLRLLDEVGRIHGVRGSMLGRWVVLKRVLGALVLAGGTEWLLDLWAERTSNRLLSTVSGGAAQGVGCGLYVARLGHVAIEVCRPIPAPVLPRPRLQELYQLLARKLLGRQPTEEQE